jgi:hypothetical protein
LALTKVTEGIRTLGTDEVIATNIATDAVTTGKILDDNVTIAKISGSAAAAADTFLKKDGTWSAVASGTSWQSVKTATFTAVAGEGYPCNTTAGGFTVDLPSSPSVGDALEVFDYAGTFDTNALTIDPAAGDKINGEELNHIMEKERSGVTLTYIDATQGWVPTSGINEGTEAIGLVSYSSELLLIAGAGAGGAYYSGGGGGGGLLYYGAETPKTPNGAAFSLIGGKVYTVVVGLGGAAPSGDGNNSTFTGYLVATQTAIGGGNGEGIAGGSGGGFGHGAGAGGAGTAGQGNNGGAGAYCAPGYPGGGGGGAGGAGAANSGCSGPGAGGAGLDYSITGASVNYAAGGGAGTYSVGAYAAAGGASATAGSASGIDAPANQGGGGGAAGDGGSGVAILRLLTADYTGTVSGGPTVTTDGSYTIIKFTGSGTYTA